MFHEYIVLDLTDFTHKNAHVYKGSHTHRCNMYQPCPPRNMHCSWQSQFSSYVDSKEETKRPTSQIIFRRQEGYFSISSLFNEQF